MSHDPIEFMKRVFANSNEQLASENYVNPRTDEETRQLIHKLVFKGASALTTE